MIEADEIYSVIGLLHEIVIDITNKILMNFQKRK